MASVVAERLSVPDTRASRTSVRQFLANPQAATATLLLLVLVGGAVFAPLVTAYSPYAIDSANRFAPPSSDHWFGTDQLGRDLYSRTVFGGRIALGIAAAATVISTLLGVVWGFVAARAGGWVEEGMLRVADVVMAVPILMFALILVAAFGSSSVTLAIITGLLLAPGTARIARSAVLTELKSDYCLAATSLGVPRLRLLFSELLPNTMPTLIARASLVAAEVIIIEASLSFLGLGVAPPAASWGTLLREGYSYMHTSASYVVFPGVVIIMGIWSFNALGNRLQTILDPRSAS